MKVHGMVAAALVAACVPDLEPPPDAIPLKEAKLIIEHNATDLDSGWEVLAIEEGGNQTLSSSDFQTS